MSSVRCAIAVATCLVQPAWAVEPDGVSAASILPAQVPSIARSADTTPIAVAAPPATCTVCIPALTHVDLIFDDALSSKTSKAGETFRFHLATAITMGERILVPVGTPGMGEVVFAKKSAFGGAAGELVLAARYLQLGERRIKLRSMAFGKLGVDRVRDLNKAIVVAAASGGSLVAASTFFIYGSENTVKPGEAAVARTAELVNLSEGVTATSSTQGSLQVGGRDTSGSSSGERP